MRGYLTDPVESASPIAPLYNQFAKMGSREPAVLNKPRHPRPERSFYFVHVPRFYSAHVARFLMVALVSSFDLNCRHSQ